MLLLAVVWKRPDRGPRIFALVWTLGWAGFSAWTGVSIARAHHAACDRLAKGSVQVAEGEVQAFTPASIDGKTEESFKVGGKVFRISETRAVAGLGRTAARGGPIRGGETVRISYDGETILRVESLAK